MNVDDQRKAGEPHKSVDPKTGEPFNRPIDPKTGEPFRVDPKTGEAFKTDTHKTTAARPVEHTAEAKAAVEAGKSKDLPRPIDPKTGEPVKAGEPFYHDPVSPSETPLQTGNPRVGTNRSGDLPKTPGEMSDMHAKIIEEDAGNDFEHVGRDYNTETHYKARPVNRDGKTQAITGYGEPFTAPKATIHAMLRRDPGCVEIMGDVEVPEKGWDLPGGLPRAQRDKLNQINSLTTTPVSSERVGIPKR